MSKQTMQWHKKCLENLRAYVDFKKGEMEREISEYKKVLSEFISYESQINQAELKKMDGFDPERFLKSKK